MVKKLSIALNPGPVEGQYTPGSSVSGTLTVEVDKPKDYKEIVVYMKGRGRVNWAESGGKNDQDLRNHSAHEDYAHLKHVVWKNESYPTGTLPAGTYTYPFQFGLPLSCPSSFSSNIGDISYEIEGVVCTGPLKLDHTVKHSFRVVELVSVGPTSGSRLENRKTVGCGLCKSGDISFTVELPNASFTAGEEILVSGYVENGSGRQVTLRCSLVEEIQYFAEDFSSHSTEHTLSSQSSAVIPPHSASEDLSVRVPIPHCRPAITRSRIIKSKFQLVASVVIPRAKNCSVSTQVTIGNESLLQQDQNYLLS